jgi:hypothetical protein
MADFRGKILYFQQFIVFLTVSSRVFNVLGRLCRTAKQVYIGRAKATCRRRAGVVLALTAHCAGVVHALHTMQNHRLYIPLDNAVNTCISV